MKNASNPLAAAMALASMALTTHSQVQPGKTYLRYNRPLNSVSLDLATGTLTRGAPVRGRSATTAADFTNLDLSGFVGVDTGGGFCEWFDAGVKGFAGNQSDLMSEIAFPYCSSMLTPASGGPGGSVKLGFYEGYTTFGGASTTAVAKLTLTGLPANSASSSFFGGFRCYFVSVSFGSLVSFADGPIGYSWRFLDVGTDGVLAGTWPFLSCVASCSGTALQVDGQGMTDVIDEYCPPGYLHSCGWFCFNTTSGTFQSISMDVREASDLAATSVFYNASQTPNPDTLSASAAIVGSSWTALLQRGTPSPPGSFALTIRPHRIAAPNGVQAPPPLPVGAGGRVLIAGPLLNSLAGTHDGSTGSVSSVIPPALSLVCLHFAAQATVLGGGVRLSSAVEGTSGTF